MLPLELAGLPNAREAAADVLAQGQSVAAPRALSAAVVGRRAAARRDRARVRDAAGGAVRGRADGQSRFGDRRAHHRAAVRAQRADADDAGRRDARSGHRADAAAASSASKRGGWWRDHESAATGIARAASRRQVRRAARAAAGAAGRSVGADRRRFLHQSRQPRGRSTGGRSAGGGSAAAVARSRSSASISISRRLPGSPTAELSTFPSVVFKGEDSALTAIRAVSSTLSAARPLEGRRRAVRSGARSRLRLPGPRRSVARSAAVRRSSMPASAIASASGQTELTITQRARLSAGPGLAVRRSRADAADAPRRRAGDRAHAGRQPHFATPRCSPAIAQSVAEFKQQLTARKKPGERIVDLEDASPQIRSAIDRAGRFLNLVGAGHDPARRDRGRDLGAPLRGAASRYGRADEEHGRAAARSCSRSACCELLMIAIARRRRSAR